MEHESKFIRFSDNFKDTSLTRAAHSGEALFAGDLRGDGRGDGFDFGAMRGFAVAWVADEHAVFVQGVAIAFLSGIFAGHAATEFAIGSGSMVAVKWRSMRSLATMR
jgi:hypothetical protein